MTEASIPTTPKKEDPYRHLAGCTFAPLIDWATPRARKSSLEMQVVATDPDHAKCYLALLRHYPFIVYLGFLLWRKNMLLLGLIDEDDARKKTQPRLFIPARLIRHVVSATHLAQVERKRVIQEEETDGVETADDEDEDNKLDPMIEIAGQLGLTGNLAALEGAEVLPGVFLKERRPLKLKQLKVIDEKVEVGVTTTSFTTRVGNFISWAARNNQLDVLVIMIEQLQLCQGDHWEVVGGIETSILVRAASRKLLFLVKTLVHFQMRPGGQLHQHTLDRALYWACDKEFCDMAQFLLDCRANPEVPNGDRTPLHAAVINNRLEATRLLVQGGKANLETLGYNGTTAIHWAAFHGHGEMLKLLIDFGADVEAQDSLDNFRPMHYAAEKNQVDALRILVEVGKAEISPLSGSGRTPKYDATNNNSGEAIALLSELEERRKGTFVEKEPVKK